MPPKKVGSKRERRERVYKRAARAQRDLFRKRRRSEMSAPVTFVKKSPQAICSLRRRGAGEGNRTLVFSLGS